MQTYRRVAGRRYLLLFFFNIIFPLPLTPRRRAGPPRHRFRSPVDALFFSLGQAARRRRRSTTLNGYGVPLPSPPPCTSSVRVTLTRLRTYTGRFFWRARPGWYPFRFNSANEILAGARTLHRSGGAKAHAKGAEEERQVRSLSRPVLSKKCLQIRSRIFSSC